MIKKYLKHIYNVFRACNNYNNNNHIIIQKMNKLKLKKRNNEGALIISMYIYI